MRCVFVVYLQASSPLGAAIEPGLSLGGTVVFEFREPWHPCDDPMFEAELKRELCPEHELYGQRVKIIARRQDRDDYLFALTDGRYANVHLTWSTERTADWPSTEFYDSQAAMEQAIQSDIDEWKRTA